MKKPVDAIRNAFVSGGCEIPRDVPYKNMRAMLKYCIDYGT